MIVNLMLFLCVYYKNVQLHVLILCTSPTLCDVLLCHVTCSHPPKAWDSHHVVVVGCCRRVSGSFSCFDFFQGSSYDFVRFIFYLHFFVTIPSSIASETMFRECYPPSRLFPKTTCFTFTPCTHTCKETKEMYTNPPTSYPPSAIHTVHIQKPSHSLIQIPHTH